MPAEIMMLAGCSHPNWKQKVGPTPTNFNSGAWRIVMMEVGFVAMIAMMGSCSDWQSSIVCARFRVLSNFTEISRDMNKLSINRTILSGFSAATS